MTNSTLDDGVDQLCKKMLGHYKQFIASSDRMDSNRTVTYTAWMVMNRINDERVALHLELDKLKKQLGTQSPSL